MMLQCTQPPLDRSSAGSHTVQAWSSRILVTPRSHHHTHCEAQPLEDQAQNTELPERQAGTPCYLHPGPPASCLNHTGLCDSWGWDLLLSPGSSQANWSNSDICFKFNAGRVCITESQNDTKYVILHACVSLGVKVCL